MFDFSMFIYDYKGVQLSVAFVVYERESNLPAGLYPSEELAKAALSQLPASLREDYFLASMLFEIDEYGRARSQGAGRLVAEHSRTFFGTEDQFKAMKRFEELTAD